RVRHEERAHEFNTSGTQQTLSIQLSPVDQHLAELRIVFGGAAQTTRTGIVFRRSGIRLLLQSLCCFPIVRSKTRNRGFGRRKERVFHSQGVEYALLQELIEAQA